MNTKLTESTKKYRQMLKNDTVFEFFSCKILPKDIAISAVMNLVFLDMGTILCLDKDQIWNAVSGHLEENETILDALKRESIEEIGVEVQNPTLIGYIESKKVEENNYNKKYPNISLIPVYISFADKVLQKKDWKKIETLDRICLSKTNSLEVLSQRSDNNQLFEIYQYAWEVFEGMNKEIQFQYFSEMINDNSQTTQVFNFCYNDENKFCIVRDKNENYYSLPGGGCNVDETPEECCIRETIEEAQIIISSPMFVGGVKVKYLNSENQVLQTVLHLRFLSKTSVIEEFIPLKNGFETDFRDFVSLNELETKIDWLKYDSGKEMIKTVKKLTLKTKNV